MHRVQWAVGIILGIGLTGNAYLVAQANQPPSERPRGPVTQRSISKVNLNNGNFSSTFVDYSFLNEPLTIHIARTYNARSNYEGFFGFGWSSNVDTYLEFINDGTILLRRGGGGHTDVFLPEAEQKGIGAVVGELLTKLKATTATQTQSYWRDLERRALEDEYYRRSLLRQHFPPNSSFTSGSNKWINRSNSNESISRVNKKNFQLDSPHEPLTIFDQNGNILEIRDPISKSRLEFKWGNRQLVSIADQAGRTVQLSYTHEQLVGKATFLGLNKEKVTTEYGYKQVGKVFMLDTVSDGYNNLVRFEYNAKGDLTKISYHDGTTEEITYLSPKDWVAKYKKWDDTFTQYSFSVDAANPLKQAVSIQYFDKNKKRLRKDEKVEYEFVKTSTGSVALASLRENLGGVIRRIVYDAKLQLPVSIEQGKNKSEMKYDTLGRLLSKKDANGLTNYSYQGNSGHPSEIVVNGRSYKYRYENTLVKSVQGPEQSVLLTYDPQGRISTIQNQSTGNLLVFSYNSFGQPLQIEQKGLGAILFQYSEVGELVQLRTVSQDADHSPVMVANKITRAFQDFLALIIPAGRQPVMDSGFNLTTAMASRPQPAAF
jgi:YD repeat-containing protein